MGSNVVSISTSQPGKAAEQVQVSQPPARSGLAQIGDAALRAEFEHCVGQIRQSLSRTAWEIVQIGRSLATMRAKLDRAQLDKGVWNDLCENDCGINRRVANRMIAAAKFADTQLAEHQTVLENLSPVVVYRLAQGDVTASVVEEVIEQASDGKKVTPRDLQAAIDRLQNEIEAKDTRNEELESANVELRKTLGRAEHARKDIELEVLQLKDQINRHDEEVEMISSERQALLDDIDTYKAEIERLKAHPVEKEVPKVPKGYASLEEALKAKEQRLREVSGELQKAEARVAEAKRQMAAFEGQRASAKASLEALESLETEIQALAAKYTAAYLASLVADSKVGAKFDRVASLLRRLADQMERAASRAGAKRR